MRVVQLSTDRKILEAGTPARKRMEAYGTLFDGLLIVLVGTGGSVDTTFKNVRVISYGGSSKIDAFLRVFTKGKKDMVSFQPNVVSSQDPFFLGLLGMRLSASVSVPLHVQVHTDFMSGAYLLENPLRFLQVFISFVVFSHTRCVRVVSKRIQKSLELYVHAPITVLPIHVSQPRKITSQRPPEFKKGFSLLAVSRLEPEKQVEVLVDAVSELPRTTHLYIIGEGSQRAQLENRAREKNIAKRVHFLGWQDDLHPYYAHADAFLQVSRYEGYGMTLIEAALSGVPIVATDVGIVGDVLPKDVVSVVTSQAGAVARAVTALKKSPKQTEEKVAAAKQAAKEHLTTKKEYLERYKQMLEACI